MTVEEQSDSRLYVRIQDVAGQRWAVPDRIVSRPELELGATERPRLYDIFVDGDQLRVVRPGVQESLFSVDFGALIFKEQFMEVTIPVPKNANIYGLGETTTSFRRRQGSRTALWARGGGLIYEWNFRSSTRRT